MVQYRAMSLERESHNPENQEEKIVVRPEGRLLQAVFGKVAPIPTNFEQARNKTVEEVLDSLKLDERLVIRARFGFEGKAKTLDETGKEVGQQIRGAAWSRERVRQIEATAIRKLRHSNRGKILIPFVPLNPKSIGKTVWNLNYGCELTVFYPHVNLRTLTLDELELKEETLHELNQMILILNAYGNYIPFTLFLAKVPLNPLSKSSTIDLQESIHRLQEKIPNDLF